MPKARITGLMRDQAGNPTFRQAGDQRYAAVGGNIDDTPRDGIGHIAAHSATRPICLSASSWNRKSDQDSMEIDLAPFSTANLVTISRPLRVIPPLTPKP